MHETLEKKMIYRYLDKMEKACLIDRVKRFNIVGKQSMAYIEKQYAVDTGFRMLNTNLVNFEDTFFLENIIYNSNLSKRLLVCSIFLGSYDIASFLQKHISFCSLICLVNIFLFPYLIVI